MSHRLLTEDEIKEINEREIEQTKKDFAGFKAATAKGECWICKDALSSFEVDKPCMHWLLMPKGFRKKHFPKIYRKFGPERIESYLRWMATVQNPFTGINDIKEEHDNKNFIDVTIKHEDLDWSISCSPGCFEGKHGKHPSHYHFQMRIKNRPFIDYGDFHIPLTDYDKWMIDIRRGKDPQIKHGNLYGAGIGSAMEDFEPETLLNYMTSSKDDSKAPFRMQTMVEAEPGKMISGDEVAKLFEESKKTGIPLAKLARKLDGVRVTTVIYPGDGIPDAAVRKRRNRGKNK